MLAIGNRQSYGDVCCTHGVIRHAGRKILDFDEYRGTLKVEAGVTIKQINRLINRKRWYLPVTPGTQYATVGGCIANDVHGKNHPSMGTFGHSVLRFRLERSDGIGVIMRSNPYFAATIGGLGLTGTILDADIQLVENTGKHSFDYWTGGKWHSAPVRTYATYPLDWWFRHLTPLYHLRRLLQYQCVVPDVVAPELMKAVGQRPFLASMKVFGEHKSLGLLSFARPGATLAMDFLRTKRTQRTFIMLDAIVREARGALYPAKDSSMGPCMFRHSFPRWEEFAKYVDKAYSSNFWERVNGTA